MTPLPSEVVFPAGDLRCVYLHWTAGDYATTYGAYHYCITLDPGGAALVVPTHDPRDNMRDVRLESERPYAAHTRGRNSYALGVAVCAMREATPSDFGRFPLTAAALEACSSLVARACSFYEIPIESDRVLTHAEAAVRDGYFGCGDDERWDIARIEPGSSELHDDDARATGDILRARIRAVRA